MKTALLSLLVVASCSRTTTSDPSARSAREGMTAEPSPPATATQQEPQPEEAPALPVDAADPAPTEAPMTRVEEGLGLETLERLRLAKLVITARLGTESVARAEEKALADPRRIGGYPIISDERPLSPDTADRLVKALTNDDDYLDVMRRCLNKTWLGARFGEAASPDRVEVILGRPCDQLVFFWSVGGVTKSWGSVVSPAMSEAVEAVVSGG